MGSSMHVELYRELPADEAFRRQWNAMVQSMAQPEVFYTWEWAAAVVRSHPETRPLFFAAFRERALVGVVALEQSHSVNFLTAPTADYCEFISAEDDRAAFIELVLRNLARLKLGSLKLANVSVNSRTAQVVRTFSQSNGYAQFSRPAYSCSQIVLESAEQRADAAIAAHNSPKRRARLTRLGAITIEHHADWRTFKGEFPNFVNAHVARFASQGKTSSLVAPSRRLFLEELGKLLSEQGSLKCSVLRLGGKPVAWHFGMAFHGKWFWYQPAFDLACDQASPGTYLLREVIQEAARSPEFRGLDLGLGEESYKSQYANSVQHTLHFTLEISKIRMARHVSRYYLAQALSQSPKMEKLARAVASRISASRETSSKSQDAPSARQLSNECGD